jgi:hypothetical protein
MSNSECIINRVGCYHPTMFCFLVLWLNFLCKERWMLMTSCPVILSYIQTWKWKQGGGAICWLWWIPATSSCNRAQWPHTGEWWWKTVGWLHCSSEAFPPVLFFLLANAWLLNIWPATLPILVSWSHHSITVLYSLSHDPSNISSPSHRYFPFIFNYIPFKEFIGWWLSIMVMCSNLLLFIIFISSFLSWSLLTVTSHFSGILSYQPKVYFYYIL